MRHVRTCECFGVQDIHIIESRSKYGTNLKVLKGSHYWLNLIKHKKEKPSVVYNNLKSQGHKISVTSVSAASQSIFDIDPVAIGNVALVMGNELHGIAKETKELAD